MQDIFKNRFPVFIGIIILIFLLFGIRVGTLQLSSNNYEQRAINNALNKITLYPARSIIYDRNGEILVKNYVVHDLFVFPKHLNDENKLFICDVLDIDTLEYNELLLDAWINSRKRQKNNAYNRSALFYSNLSQKQYSILRENLFRLDGFYIEARTDRSYNMSGGGHALGYLGEATESLLSADEYYQPGDLVGITGIERYYEEFMRGKKGIQTVWQDRTYVEKGKVDIDSFNIAPISGPDFISTLDIKLQKFAEELLENKKGSIVAIEPATGEILAYINKPDYDPNLLVGKERGKEFRKMLIDPKKPLYNRAVKGKYPPGSTVKTVLALIGMQEGVINPGSLKGCGGGYRLGSIVVGCHGHASPLDVTGSIRISCNSYYCDLFRQIIDNPKYNDVKTGYAALEKHWRSFGLGNPIGIDLLGESSGNIPTVEQLDRRHGKNWRSSMVVSLGIGQGEMLLTPLQIANVAVIMANRGFYYPPHLIKKIKGIPDSMWKKTFTKRKYTSVNRKYFDPVITGMSQVTLPGGTAPGMNFGDVQICGKTGTAQNPHGKDHSLFIAFAPKINPKIAVGVIIENGGFGATFAAPIASLMIEKYFNPDSTITRPYLYDRVTKTRIAY